MSAQPNPATPMTVTELRNLQRRDARVLWLVPAVCLGVVPAVGVGFLMFGPSLLHKFLEGLVLLLQDIRALNSTVVPLVAFLGGALYLHFRAGALARGLLEAALLVTPEALQPPSGEERERRALAGAHLVLAKDVGAHASASLNRFDFLVSVLGWLAVAWALLTALAGTMGAYPGTEPWVNLAACLLVAASLNWPRTWASLNAVATPADLARAHLGEGPVKPSITFWRDAPDTRYSVLELPAILKTHLANRCVDLEQERADA